VRFDEFLRRVERKITVDDGSEYSTVGVRWYGNGAYLRDRLLGADIARKQQWVIRTGDVVYNKLFAWKGSFAIADDVVDGHLVSDKFPTYTLDEALVDPALLSYYFRTPDLGHQAERLSKGAAAISKLTLNPPQFWDLTIPLPPISKQREIVEVLNGVASLVTRSEADRNEARRAAIALGSSMLNAGAGMYERVPLSELLHLRRPDIAVEPDADYDFAGVYSFGRGVFNGPSKRGSEFAYKQLTRLHAGDFVYPKLMAWEGAFGVAATEHEGLVVSPEFPVFEVKINRLLPETLEVYFGQSDVWQTVSGASRGTNVRRRRLHPLTFLAHEMPLPPMEVQLRIRKVLDATRRLIVVQDEVAEKLGALMPSILNKVFHGAG